MAPGALGDVLGEGTRVLPIPEAKTALVTSTKVDSETTGRLVCQIRSEIKAKSHSQDDQTSQGDDLSTRQTVVRLGRASYIRKSYLDRAHDELDFTCKMKDT